MEHVDGLTTLEALHRQAPDGRLSRRAALRRATVLGLSAPVIAGLLAACGGDDDDDDPDATATTGGAAPTATTAGGSAQPTETARNATFNLNPVGAGPYKVAGFRPDDTIIFEMNENYREEDKPYFQQIEFKGGGFAMLDETHAVCAIGHRGNAEGARQVEQVLATLGIELLRVHCRGWSCHIDGGLVMVDHKTALIAPHKLPWTFLETLKALGIRTIDVDPSEANFGTNCLTIALGRVLIAADCPRTTERLHAAGIEATPIPYSECHKNGGGLHCSTMPLVRD